MRALILAGGKGTRLRPLTDLTPKPLVPFMGEPFAVGQLRRLAAAGVTDVTVLVGADAAPFAPLIDAGKAIGLGVDVATEDAPLDTAGAARRALSGQRGGPVLVCNGDVLTDLDYAAVVRAHREADAAVTLTLTRVADTSAFGVVVCDPGGRVRRFVEKPPPGTLPDDTVNAGTYVLAPGVFDAFAGDGPLSFEREVFPQLLAAGATVIGVTSDAHWADLGTPERYLAGHRAVLDGRCDWPVAADLETVEATVRVSSGARVADDAQLGPHVVVGDGAEVGSRAGLTDTVLHGRARVGAGARLSGVIVGPDATVADGADLADTVVV
ncbi:NDP-sugar synthase [soil metagenome]|jgi:NDP-sugar pyrophosphorylase family protein